MMKLNFHFAKETKACYRFETATGPDWTALYLKKRAVEAAGIDPHGGITVTIDAAGAPAQGVGERLGFGRGSK